MNDFYDSVSQEVLVDSTENDSSEAEDLQEDFVDSTENDSAAGEDPEEGFVDSAEESAAPVVDLPASETGPSFDSLDSFLAGLLAGSAVPSSDVSNEVDEGWEFVGVETFALSPITSSTGLKGVLLDVVGPYDNIVTQYQYRQNTSTNYSYVNEITPDYPWIFSSVLFIVLLLSVFRLFGRCLSWMK